jgi:hypothetical protein
MEKAAWSDVFFQCASELVRLAEVTGTPFNETDQAEHMYIAVKLMELCGKLDME